MTAKGVCCNTTGNPTITDSQTTDGTGLGSFTSNITGLSANTIYHVCAYATNSAGTSYDNDLTFTTTRLLTDIDGNAYKTVQIGSQVWMAENLRTTKYNDNTTISLVTDNTQWGTLSTPGYCWYNNDAISYKSTYGALYNWYAVNTGKLCPIGWHVPTDMEWTILTDYLGGESVSSGKLREAGIAHWITPNTGATNENGFTALPGGSRNGLGSYSPLIGYEADFWTSTTGVVSTGFFRFLLYDRINIYRDYYSNVAGLSVRCLKD